MIDRNGLWSRVQYDLNTMIDLRHANLLRGVLRFGFGKCLEIGSLHGASLVAFIEALQAGEISEVHIAEPNVRQPLLDVLSCESRVNVHQSRGVDVLRSIPDFDFVFVDGDHSLNAVSEEVHQLLRHGTQTIMAHDTNATHCGYGECEGAILIKQTFMGHPDYYCLEDSAPRHGEGTGRGLFFASRSYDVWQHAKTCLRGIQ